MTSKLIKHKEPLHKYIHIVWILLETSAVELRRMEGKDNVMENSYAMFQIREAVGCWQMFFKIGVLKNLANLTKKKSCVKVPF